MPHWLRQSLRGLKRTVHDPKVMDSNPEWVKLKLLHAVLLDVSDSSVVKTSVIYT